ncbi:MAG TPA: hypothetical protein VML00_01510 [Bacteroidota bacterium]|nr:hypothetical protein [Bacteroidota bacterium]
MKKVLLILAGILTVVVLTGSLLLYLNREKILSYSIERALTKVEEQVVLRLPDAREVVEAKADFVKLHGRLEEGTVSTEDVKSLAVMFYGSYREGTIDSARAREIVGEVHRLAAAPRARPD